MITNFILKKTNINKMTGESVYSDAELIASLKNARMQDDAIRFIYKNYYDMLESYVVNNNGNSDDSADAIQETIVAFVELVEQDKFRGESSIKSFLFAITKNIWLSELRKRGNADKRNRAYEKTKEENEHATVDQLVKREYFKSIQLLFEKLGEKCKQLLMAVYYEDLAMIDIVKLMPEYQNEQVIRNKKYKCMKQLNEMIEHDAILKSQLKNALRNAGQ